jgi:hypothetical protein
MQKEPYCHGDSPQQKEQGAVVSIRFVRAIKYDDITKCCIVKTTLAITPEQSLQVPFPISLVLEKEIRISTFALCQETNDCLSITSGNCLHLIAMTEIV